MNGKAGSPEDERLPCWTIHCDGTALPDGRGVGVGAVLVSPEGVRHTVSRVVVRAGGSNEAEALAMRAALEAARSLGARAVCVWSDSVVVVTEVTEGPRTQVEPLTSLCAEVRAQLRDFDETEVRWVSRRHNTEADALARAALGLAPKPLAPHPRKRRRAR